MNGSVTVRTQQCILTQQHQNRRAVQKPFSGLPGDQ